MPAPVPLRVALLISLIGCFLFQTLLVYCDPTGRETPPLGDEAVAGRKLWHENNCQVCHQIYGFGGFLGPDLTNAAPRVSRARLKQLVTQGSRQMPAFNLSDEQIDQIHAFLVEVDRTGVGQARRRGKGDIDPARLAAYLGSAELSPAERRGAEVFKTVCSACHVPLKANPVGNGMAPDPSLIAGRVVDAEILTVVQKGRPEKGMPPSDLNEAMARDTLAFLHWLALRRADLENMRNSGGHEPPPWFEYK